MKSDNGTMEPRSSAILILSVASALAYAVQLRSASSISRGVTKTASIALLAVLAFLEGAPGLLSAALLIGSVGDAFLAFETDETFLKGLTSFLGAHILYTIVFATEYAPGGLPVSFPASVRSIMTSGDWHAAAAGTLAVLTLTLLVRLVPSVDGDLRAPIIVYSSAIFIMTLTALSLDNAQVLAGALLFTASDGLLATDKFLVSPASPHRAWMQHIVWALYYSGQLLIALGF